MTRTFKVGDRVAVYTQANGRRLGVVIEVSDAGLCVNNWHAGCGMIQGWYHPKQCRKLVKKERVKRIAVIHNCPSRVECLYPNLEQAECAVQDYIKDGYNARIVHFIEAKRKERG